MRQETVLRKAAETLGVTLRELARRSGISPNYLQDLMHGRALPSHETANGLVAGTGGVITIQEIASWKRAPGGHRGEA